MNSPSAPSTAPRLRCASVPLTAGHLRLSLLLGMPLLLLAAADAGAQETPVGEKWWPSEWGPEDERGAVNRITPEKVLEAVSLVEEGRVYELGRTYEPGMPLFGNRHYKLTIPGSPTGGPLGDNGMVYHDELFSGEIGQIGTQFDALGHAGVRVDGEDVFYNGFRREDFATPYGLERLGVENVGAIVTRGVLVDVAGHRGVERLEVGYEITPDDLRGALEEQGVEIRAGDAVFIRTGHGTLWMEDNETYNSGEPGIGLAAGKWLIDKEIVLAGADNFGVEVVPAPDPDRAWEVHQWFLAKNGIHNLENLDLEALARDEVYEFLFVFAPVPLQGATGSPGNPVAVR